MAFFPNLRRFVLIAAEFVFNVFSTSPFLAEIDGSAAEIPGNKRVTAFLFWLRCVFWFTANFLEYGRNFRRNALRQKIPPQENLGMKRAHLLRAARTNFLKNPGLFGKAVRENARKSDEQISRFR